MQTAINFHEFPRSGSKVALHTRVNVSYLDVKLHLRYYLIAEMFAPSVFVYGVSYVRAYHVGPTFAQYY